MFNASILELESQINYHQEQKELAEEELDRLKMTQAFAEDAAEKVEDALEHIDPKYIDIFKEHLLTLFPTEAPVYLEEKVEEVIEPQEVKKEKEFGPLSYYELTGKPDTRPDTYEDLAPNIVYSSNARAYVGFNDRQEAEEFRDSISEPSMLSDTDTMNGYKYEVKFYCSKDYIQEIARSVNSMSDDTEESSFEKIDGEIMFNHTDSMAYMAFSAKGRANNYGVYLSKILDIAFKYTVDKEPKPSMLFDSKYQLVLEGITYEDALHLQSFDLKKEWDDSLNKEARELWRDTRKREVEPAYTPLPKAIALEDVKLGDLVTTDAKAVKDKQYKVLAHKELGGVPHVEAICIFNREMPALVNNCSWFKEVYPVDLMDVCIDPQFRQPEEKEEVLTEDVQIYVPKKKEEYKPVLSKAERETPLVQLAAGDAVHRKIGDSIFEVVGMARKDNKMYAECVLISSTNLANRIGNTYFFDNGLYLCEEEPVTV